MSKAILHLPTRDIIFADKKGKEIIKLSEDGDILIKGKLIEQDIELVEAMREFLLTGKKGKQNAK